VTRIVLDLEQRVEFTASQLTSPNRLIIELRGKDRPAPSIGKVTEVNRPGSGRATGGCASHHYATSE
jgi:hypothetical protein